MNIIQKNGKYWKECDIVILPTKGRKLNFKCDCKDEEFHHYHCGLVYDRNNLFLNGDLINLYILSNEQINEGDYYFDKEDEIIFKCLDKQEAKARNDSREIYEEDRWFKVIASTDNSLTVACKICNSTGDIGPGINYYIDCPKCNAKGKIQLPKLSEDFIKKYVESNGSIKKVLVEYEGIESIIEQRINTIHTFEYKLKLNSDNTINILIEDSVEEVAKEKSLQYYDEKRRGFELGFLAGAEWQKNQLNN